MGLIVSYVVRRRWLSLAGLGLALLGVPFYAAGNPDVGAVFVFVGAGVMAVQVAISFFRNVHARGKGEPPTF
jgi:hypothetical protein